MDELTYEQRLKLGTIHLRRELADAARQRAVAADLRGDLSESQVRHAEADQHEAAIIAAVHELVEQPQLQSRHVGLAKVTPLDLVKSAIGRAA
jgi:hypothetical protein